MEETAEPTIGLIGEAENLSDKIRASRAELPTGFGEKQQPVAIVREAHAEGSCGLPSAPECVDKDESIAHESRQPISRCER